MRSSSFSCHAVGQSRRLVKKRKQAPKSFTKSKNLFNYKNQGKIDEQFKEEFNGFSAYVDIPEMTKDDVEGYRTMLNEFMGSMAEMEPYKTCLCFKA